MELILVRHGRPEHVENADGPADPPLTDVGRRQALAMAGWLATEQIDALYTSPMNRAVETAAPLSRLLEMEATVRRGVREFDAEDRSYIPLEVMRQDKEKFRSFVEREQATDRTAFYEQVVESLETIVADHRSQRVAVVCHGGVIAMWCARVIGIEPRMFVTPDYTSINRFMVSSGGVASIITLNERAHLRSSSDLLLL